MDDEILEIVDKDGKVIGRASRAELHRNPGLLHRVVHVLVFDPSGRLLLQRRSMTKDTAPGKWDTSVGGHVAAGEETMAAAGREMREELGISGIPMDFVHTYIYSNMKESELVTTYSCVYEGEIRFDKEEIDEVAYWEMEKIAAATGSGVFSGQFEAEIRRYQGRKG